MRSIYAEITQLQKTTNDITKADWMENPPPYLRAAMMETVECIDHINSWKWWKKNQADFGNAAMEMVDVLHFVISQELVSHECDVDVVGGFIEAQLTEHDNGASTEAQRDYVNINDVMENLAGGFIQRNINYKQFMQVVNFCGLDANKLCLWYLGKNALNNFRQANGYKQGSYHKAWFGGEDNDTLLEIINHQLNDTPAGMSRFDFIYHQLGENYQRALAEKARSSS
jgi:dimeric dUTPase (all-alpha-NTP-PPase superfamily)